MNPSLASTEQELSKLSGDRFARMMCCVDILWDALHPNGVSWAGFYLHEGKDELILGPNRDKPACSPIGMHGACGQSFTSRKAMVVHDVAELGKGYIACDPRDVSELVLPLFDEDGECWGVLDLDSHEVGNFLPNDVKDMHRLLIAAGLTFGPCPEIL